MQLPDAIGLVVMALATWRIAAMLYYENGPWNLFERLRYKAGVYLPEPPFWGKQLGCFWCLSFWSALVCTAVGLLWWYALLPFALSGAAVLLSGGGRMIWRMQVDG